MSASPTVPGPQQPPDARPQFRVAAFGLGARFERLLEIVLRHARHNQYRFVLAGSRGPGDYDVALVDMTAKGGPEVASTLRRLPDTRPVITVGRRGDPTRARDDLLQQKFTVQLLETLNRVVEQHLLPKGRAARRESAGELTGLLGRRPRALLVDESHAARRQLALALAQMGIDCEAVGSVGEATDVLAARTYELVIAEVALPDGDGLELTRRIKRDPRLKALPVVVLTGRASMLDLLRGALSRCDSYLVKPASLHTLRLTVVRCLNKAHRAPSVREPLAVT